MEADVLHVNRGRDDVEFSDAWRQKRAQKHRPG
jgi:hypothetical protein